MMKNIGRARAARRSRTRRIGTGLDSLEPRALLATFTVTHANDSGEGSLRQAIIDANNSPNALDVPDRIEFDIQENQGEGGPTITQGSGPHTIALVSPLPNIDETVVIDGYTQGSTTADPSDDAKPNTLGAGQGTNAILKIELDGTNAGDVSGLVIIANASTIRGLVINRFKGSQVEIRGAHGAVLEGNFIGTDASGVGGLDTGPNAVLISESQVTRVGGTTPAARNLISGRGEIAVHITGLEAAENEVLNNIIGLDASGFDETGDFIACVQIDSNSSLNTIGGLTAEARNVISGDNIIGIDIQSEQNTVVGNYVGTDVTGTNVIASYGDAVFVRASNNQIGGTAPGAGNLIRGSKGRGVVVETNATAVSILGNSIYGNGGLGIDLIGGIETDGATANDDGDVDTGANQLQNFPVIMSATATPNGTTIGGTLDALAGERSYRIEFFANGPADPAGRAEGQTFLGAAVVETNSAGDATFSIPNLPPLPSGQSILTATATDPNGNTSEFSDEFSTVNRVADLVVKIEAPASVPALTDLTYVITVNNIGPNAATGVVLSAFPLPENTQFVSTSAGTYNAASNSVTASLGTLANGGSSVVTIVVRPTSAAVGHAAINTVNVIANEVDPTPTNNRTQVASTTVTPAGDTTPPTVVSLQRYGFHADRTYLVVTYSEPVTASALDVSNYSVRLAGRDGRFGTHDDVVCPIQAAQGDGSGKTVVLLMRNRLGAFHRYQLGINGSTSNAIADAAGNRLDGNNDGKAGGNYFRVFDRNIIAGTAKDLLGNYGALGRRIHRASRHRRS